MSFRKISEQMIRCLLSISLKVYKKYNLIVDSKTVKFQQEIYIFFSLIGRIEEVS